MGQLHAHPCRALAAVLESRAPKTTRERKALDFTTVALATSVLGLLLGVGWLFAGPLVLRRWNVPAEPAALLVGRRLGAVYVGMAVLLFLARSTPASPVRSALCIGLAVSMALLAAVGLFEFGRKRASGGILVSVAIEALLAAGFIAAA
jgi:hypothetical protein